MAGRSSRNGVLPAQGRSFLGHVVEGTAPNPPTSLCCRPAEDMPPGYLSAPRLPARTLYDPSRPSLYRWSPAKHWATLRPPVTVRRSHSRVRGRRPCVDPEYGMLMTNFHSASSPTPPQARDPTSCAQMPNCTAGGRKAARTRRATNPQLPHPHVSRETPSGTDATVTMGAVDIRRRYGPLPYMFIRV